MALDKIILLTGSNASKKYFTDTFEVLSWPRGWVMHFRYFVKWVDDDLQKQLPQRTEALKSSDGSLKGTRVLAAYLFQESRRNQQTHELVWNKISLYPLRYGTLVEAYRIGTGTYDIAHFYFQVDGYYLPEKAKGPSLKPDEWLAPRAYATLAQFPIAESSAANDESAAYEIVEGIQPQHAAYQLNQDNPDQKRRYYPVICHLRELRPVGNRDNPLKPKFGREAHGSFYELTERKDFLFDFSFYVPSWSGGAPGSGSKVTLEYDSKAFATTAKRALAVESRYDEHTWLVVPASTPKDILRELEFDTAVKVPTDIDAEPADLVLSIPVTIKPDKPLRFRAAAGDFAAAVGLALGTIALALISRPPFGLPVEVLAVAAVVGYAIWLVISTLSRGWRL